MKILSNKKELGVIKISDRLTELRVAGVSFIPCLWKKKIKIKKKQTKKK